MPAELLVISASLRSGSYSRIMAAQFLQQCEELKITASLLDLRDYPLPLCDGESAYAHPSVAIVTGKIQQAQIIVLATPIYNFDGNAAAKNLIELTGSAWEDKIVGFLCAAGGASSYMSVLGLANSLMLDFRCLILPRFVYAVGSDFAENKVRNPEIVTRIKQLTESTLRFNPS